MLALRLRFGLSLNFRLLLLRKNGRLGYFAQIGSTPKYPVHDLGVVVDDLEVEVHEFLLLFVDQVLLMDQFDLLEVLVAHKLGVYVFRGFQLVVLFFSGNVLVLLFLLAIFFAHGDWVSHLH